MDNEMNNSINTNAEGGASAQNETNTEDKTFTQEEVLKLIQSKGNGASSAEITKETAQKMSIVELNKMASEQPELFAKLFN